MPSYKSEELQLAKYAKALAHPARISILQLLLKRQTCICGDLVNELPIAQSTVSQHLKELKKAGLIKGEVEGTAVCYCIDETAFKKARKFFENLFKSTPVNKSICC
jgi:DNA-binding transcriptional ArsR family regulator